MQREDEHRKEPSIEPRNYACRPAHIGPVLIAECLDHHCFFARHPPEKQDPEAGETRWSRNPVGQKQGLTERHQPETGIHRVSHQGVDAGCDERVAFAEIEADGPIMAEVAMTTVEQPQATYLDGDPEIGQRRNQWIIGKTWKMSDHINERHDAESGERGSEKCEFARPSS